MPRSKMSEALHVRQPLSNFPGLLLEMPQYCSPVKIVLFRYFFLFRSVGSDHQTKGSVVKFISQAKTK